MYSIVIAMCIVYASYVLYASWYMWISGLGWFLDYLEILLCNFASTTSTAFKTLYIHIAIVYNITIYYYKYK